MLALLKLWRSLHVLKSRTKSFEHMFGKFIANATGDEHFTMENIEYFHKCSKGTQEQNMSDLDGFNPNSHIPVDNQNDLPVEESATPAIGGEMAVINVSEEDIERALENPFPGREQLYAHVAIEVGLETGVLDNCQCIVLGAKDAAPMIVEQLMSFKQWEDALKQPGFIDNSDKFVHGLANAVNGDLPIVDIGRIGVGVYVMEAMVMVIC